MLYIVGLGDENDITVKGLEAVHVEGLYAHQRELSNNFLACQVVSTEREYKLQA
jgi:hypothetical protein